MLLIKFDINAASSRVENSAQVLPCQLKFVHGQSYKLVLLSSLEPGNTYWKGSTVYLLVLTRIDKLFFKENFIYIFTKQATVLKRPSLPVGVPCCFINHISIISAHSSRHHRFSVCFNFQKFRLFLTTDKIYCLCRDREH